MIETNIFAATSSVNYMSQAFAELKEADPGLKMTESLGNGIMLVIPSLPKEDFARKLQSKRPVFVRHICSADFILPISADTKPEEITYVIESFKDRLQVGDKVAVQVRKAKGEYTCSPLEFKNAFDELLKTQIGAETEIKEPEKIISVLLDGDKCYIGLSRAEDNLSSWSGGMIHYKKDDANDISRAKFKLMEAIYIFNIDMDKVKTALDLGAAPGGWTSVLLEHGVHVTAVDTGDMDKRLDRYKSYRFLKTNVADMNLEDEEFDMLTSDISWNPINTAKMITAASKHLRKGGTAVVTVKLMGEKVTKTIKTVTNIYTEIFEIIGARQLFHNRDEITLYMQKR